MVALGEAEIPIYRDVVRQRRRGFDALAEIIGRLAVPFLQTYVVLAAKRVGDDLLEYAVPEVAEVVSVRKNFKTGAKNVGWQTLRKHLVSARKKKNRAIGGRELAYGRQANRVVQNKICKTNRSVAKKHFDIFFSLFMSRPFMAVSGNLGGKVSVFDNVLSSHEQGIYPTFSLDEKWIEFDIQNDQDYYVDLKQTYLALKLKFVRGRSYENRNTNEV